jgi:uncharacterized protein
LPTGKPAGERCPHLRSDLTCALFGSPDRPAVCSSLAPSPDMCGDSAAAALAGLIRLEALTAPRAAAVDHAGPVDHDSTGAWNQPG